MLAAALFSATATAQPLSGVAPAAPRQQQAGSLNLAGAIALAQLHNSELRVLSGEFAALDARAIQAGATPNPTLEYLREGKREQGGSSAVQVAIPLELGGKRSARIDAANAESRLASADLFAARLRVQAEVVAAFNEAFLAEKRLELAIHISATARQSSNSAKSRVLAGKVSPVEETRARVAEANLQLEVIQARREFEAARITLALLCGIDRSAVSALAAPDIALPAAPDPGVMADRLGSAPSMLRATAELDWRTATARLERAKRYPDLSLIVGQKRDGIAAERQLVLGLSIPLPLFDQNKGAILEAERRIDKSKAELEGGRQRLQAGIEQGANRLTAALEQERVIREDVLPGSQSAFAAAGKGFDAGKFSFLEVLDAQRTYFQAQAQHLRAISEAHRAAADLATLTGPIDSVASTPHMQDGK
jgi:cobalt-zinc-cadmium efflux system outer membrane protein